MTVYTNPLIVQRQTHTFTSIRMVTTISPRQSLHTT